MPKAIEDLRRAWPKTVAKITDGQGRLLAVRFKTAPGTRFSDDRHHPRSASSCHRRSAATNGRSIPKPGIEYGFPASRALHA
jgi:hypothetical protein